MQINLRPARPEDAEEMARWFADLADLAQWGGPDVSFPLTPDQLAAWIAEGGSDKPRLCFTAVDENDVPVGHIQFLRDPKKRWARLGRFAVARRKRGQGFGRALFDYGVAYAFDDLDVEHLALAVLVENTKARGMYERSGFRFEERTQSMRSDGVAYNMDTLGLSRADWMRRNGADRAAGVA